MEAQNEIIVTLAYLADSQRAGDLLAKLDGPITTIEQAGAALELYCLGTGMSLDEAATSLGELPVRDGPNAMAYQWLQENHPELF